MKTKQIKPEKRYAIYFLHQLGLTYVEEQSNRRWVNEKIKIWRNNCPNFKYKIIPVLITPIIDKPKEKKHYCKCGYDKENDHAEDCPKSLLGTSKMIIKNGKPVIK